MRRDPRRPVHVPRRALLLIAAAAVVVGVSSAWAGRAAGPTAGVKFVLQYKGSFEGSWHDSLTKPPSSNKFDCGDYDQAGTLTSSVRPGARFTVTVAKEFGRTLYLDWGKSQGRGKGVISYTPTAQGWLMTYTGGQCVRQPLDLGPCAKQTFVDQVSIEGASGLHRTVEPAYLYWPLGPPNSVTDCMTGTMWSGVGTPQEGAATKLDLSRLYRCGIRKPRGCRFTIGGTKEYTFDAPGSVGETHTGNGKISWSITFVAVGKVTR